MYMSKTLKLKKGFTLIEMLIVISIIAILAVMSVAGYMAFRKAALIDLSADSLIAQIDEMREKTIHGTKIEEVAATAGTPSDEFLKCYGLKVSLNGGKYEMSAVNYRFTNKKVWKEGRWQYQGCGEGEDVGIFEMDSMVKVGELKIIDEEVENEEELVGAEPLVLRFIPPNGDLEFLKNGAVVGGKNYLNIKINYGDGGDDRYSRTVKINLANGQAVKIQNE